MIDEGKTMKIFARVIFITILMIGLMSCGGVSAPPVSLPSPVTGRIVVSSADASGNISVTGEDGSVTADSTVMVINASTTSFNLPEKFINLLIKDVYAATDFPPVCSQTGRSCALADANGAFELSIPGADGDEIIIVLIDPTTGVETSDRLTRSVPDNLSPFSGEPIGVKLNPEAAELYVLLKGDTSNLNRIQTATLSPWSINSGTTDVGGTLATQMDVSPGNVGVINKGGTSDDVSSLFIATIDPVTQAFSTFSQVDLVGTATPYIAPTDMIFLDLTVDGVSESFAVFSSNTTAPSLDFWSISGNTFQNFVIDVNQFNLGDHHLATYALDDNLVFISSPNGFVSIDILAAVSEFEKTEPDGSTITLNNLTVFRNASIATWLSGASAPFPDDAITLPSGADVVDIRIIGGGNHIYVTDQGNDAIYRYELSSNDNGLVQIASNPTVITATDIIDPGKIELGQNLSTLDLVIFVTLQNGDDTSPDSVLALLPDLTNKVNPICLQPTDMAFDSANALLYVSCLKSKTVARIPIADLLP